jgi:hypothetical protein
LPKYWAAQTDFSEAIEINLHPNNIYREEGFKLNREWKPTTRLLCQLDAYLSDQTYDNYREKHSKKNTKGHRAK